MVDRTRNQDVPFPQEQEVTFNLLNKLSDSAQRLNTNKIRAEREIDIKIVQLRNECEAFKRLSNTGIPDDNPSDKEVLRVIQANIKRIQRDIDTFE